MEGLAFGYVSFIHEEWVVLIMMIDWSEAHPPSPNYLRLIYGGKMLADKSTLSGDNYSQDFCCDVDFEECGIGPNKPNILHVSIRPADFVDDERISLCPFSIPYSFLLAESGKKILGIPRRSSRNGCCNCVIS